MGAQLRHTTTHKRIAAMCRHETRAYLRNPWACHGVPQNGADVVQARHTTWCTCGTEGHTMAKIHRSYRIEEGTLDKLTEWAEEHNQSTTQAMEHLLWRGMEAEERADTTTDKDAELQELQARLDASMEQRALMADNLRDLRELRATLTAQLTAKDAQIAQMQEALNHAQFLQAMEATSKLTGETAEAMKQGGIWAWLAKKIGR